VNRKESLFGTDGIRGTPRVFPLDAGTLRRLGFSLVELICAGGGRGRVVLGRDTRESGPWIEARLLEGIASAGGAAERAGVIPTPGVAYLTRTEGFDAGVVISASHNPFEDNGVKIFSKDGFKLSDGAEAEIEHALASGAESKGENQAPQAPVDPGPESPGFVEAYASFLASTFSAKTPCMLSVVLDCAHGAASAVAPRVFSDLGFEVHTVASAPDGRNINDSCGALHPEGLAGSPAPSPKRGRASAWPSTGTPTAPSSRAPRGASSTATTSCTSPPPAANAPGRSAAAPSSAR
jgi:phosphoglucosamine mutase